MEKDEITFVCISDTHTKTYGLTLPPGDVLIHAGDFTSTGLPDEVEAFNTFLAAQKFEYKVVIAGNHDITFDVDNYEPHLQKRFPSNFTKYKQQTHFTAQEVKAKLKDCIYLEDSSCEIHGYKIYGSPWTPVYDDWGFNLPKGEKLLEKWQKIPSDTDILITHGPPYKILDKTLNNINTGCENLLKEIQERIKPLYHIFGHIHEAYGVEKVDGTTFINASTCTLSYRPNNKPVVFTLPKKK
jgi:Icc-related predicted phosphoesterase